MNFINYIFLTLFSVSAAAQDTIPNYPKGYFGSPLDVPFLLAGNFGEPRPSHFHMGIDIRTGEKEGMKVYALADGYVSRIGVSPYGYGNVLYITYPNGYTSVFGHLQRFNQTISVVVRQQQYAKELFSVDFTLKPGEIPVHKGELVAYSGNTGGSGGPHLHFEMRDVLERTINPFNFGYKSADHIAPLVGSVKFYPMDETKYTAEAYRISTLCTDSCYIFKNGMIKLNASAIGIAVNTFDKMDEKLHSVGPYDMKEYDDDSLIFEYKVDRISFDYIRYIIAQVDYPIFMKEGSRSFQKCYLEHNNPMHALYHNIKNRGIINLADGNVHHIRIETADYVGNKSILRLDLQYDPFAPAFKPKPNKYMLALSPDTVNVIKGDGFYATIPGKALLDSVFIDYSSTAPVGKGVFSNVIKIGNSYDLLGYYSVSIQCNGLPDSLKDKALIVWKSAAGGIASKGGKWEGNYLTAQSREFGSFYITIDTVPPKIMPINIGNGKSLRGAKSIAVAIHDGLSGVAEYKGYLDGKWELMELDGKSSILRMALPASLKAGEHNFKLVVTDDKNNKTTYSAKFNY